MVYILISMLVKELLDMKLRDVLDEFCIVFSPECDWFYGIGRWDDVSAMYDEYDLEDEVCFDGDFLIQYALDIDEEADVLDLDHMRRILDCIGIEKKGA
mgnify:CR=1 FL=1